MRVEMTPQPGKGPGINIYGPQVTEFVWKLFSYSINANCFYCPWYKARQEAGAFFQGGSDIAANWVFIEFWKPDTAFHYVNLINRALAFIDDNGQPVEVRGVINTKEKRKWVTGMLSLYEVEGKFDNEVVTFTPTDPTMVTDMVEKNIEWGDTFNPTKLPVDVSDLVWGIYQNIGQNSSSYIANKDKRQELINDLRSIADQLQTTI